jgi:hypothetical protein
VTIRASDGHYLALINETGKNAKRSEPFEGDLLVPFLIVMRGGISNDPDTALAQLKSSSLTALDTFVRRITWQTQTWLTWFGRTIGQHILDQLHVREVSSPNLLLQLGIYRRRCSLDSQAKMLGRPQSLGGFPHPRMKPVRRQIRGVRRESDCPLTSIKCKAETALGLRLRFILGCLVVVRPFQSEPLRQRRRYRVHDRSDGGFPPPQGRQMVVSRSKLHRLLTQVDERLKLLLNPINIHKQQAYEARRTTAHHPRQHTLHDRRNAHQPLPNVSELPPRAEPVLVQISSSDHKTSQVLKLITRLVAECAPRRRGRRVRILNCLGIRASESIARSKKSPFGADPANWSQAPMTYRPARKATAKKAAQPARPARPGVPHGLRQVDRWLPIFSWTDTAVWAEILASGLPWHPAYFWVERLSCPICVLAPRTQLVIAAKLNPALARAYVRVERIIGHTLKPGVSIEDIATEAGVDLNGLDEPDCETDDWNAGTAAWQLGEPIGPGMTVPMVALPPIAGLDQLVPPGITPATAIAAPLAIEAVTA